MIPGTEKMSHTTPLLSTVAHAGSVSRLGASDPDRRGPVGTGLWAPWHTNAPVRNTNHGVTKPKTMTRNKTKVLWMLIGPTWEGGACAMGPLQTHRPPQGVLPRCLLTKPILPGKRLGREESGFPRKIAVFRHLAPSAPGGGGAKALHNPKNPKSKSGGVENADPPPGLPAIAPNPPGGCAALKRSLKDANGHLI